jgi:hypothetical protein
MPSESHYYPTARLIHLRFWGNLTGTEFMDAFKGEKAFFDGMSGTVGLIADASEIKALPPGVLSLARKAQFARYRPIIVVIVGGNRFVRSMAEAFGKITGIQMSFAPTYDEALTYIQSELARS